MGQQKRPLRVLLARPRGFCAGVERAIEIVEKALQKYGAPVYVRHEIVHNRHVVQRLQNMGAVFVQEIADAPSDRPIIFSAHGVPKSVPVEASERRMLYLDATCPLVSKVHLEADRLYSAGRDVLLIGHAGHPEVVGTMGQLPEGSITLIETAEDARVFSPRNPENLAFITQTTLSVGDTAEIVGILRQRFSSIVAPHKNNICYATTNRQTALKSLVGADVVIVLGSARSSNAQRLVEIAGQMTARSYLIDDADDLDPEWLRTAQTVGITAAASTPEDLVQTLVGRLSRDYELDIEEMGGPAESVRFKLPQGVSR